MTKRQDRLNELLREESADFVRSISNNQSLITVTRVSVSPDVRQATVYFTTIPDSQEVIAEDFLNRHGSELRAYIKSRLYIKRLPFFKFAIDQGERHRQRLDELSKDI